MKLRSILLTLLIAFTSSFISIKANNPVDEVIEIDKVENVNIPAPPVVVIPDCPVAIAIAPDAVDFDAFCSGLVDEINALIAQNNDLKNSLANLKTQINDTAADMLDVIDKARRVLRRLNGCFGLMQRTRSCAGPGYQPGDWTNHNPNGSFNDMGTARDKLIDLRNDIAALDRAADSRIRQLNNLLADANNCDSKEDATALREALAAIATATNDAFNELAQIQADALAAINDFNTAYADFKAKIAAFITKTDQVIGDNAPNSMSNIRRTCGLSRRAAARERRRRARVLRCLRRLKTQFNNLP